MPIYWTDMIIPADRRESLLGVATITLGVCTRLCIVLSATFTLIAKMVKFFTFVASFAHSPTRICRKAPTSAPGTLLSL